MSHGDTLSKSVFSRDTLKKFENFTLKVSLEDTLYKIFEFKLKLSLK